MHLNERLAEFVYEELTPGEMAEARQHVGTCADCKARVDEFARLHHALRAMPDEDLPRHIVFAPADHVKRHVLLPLRWLVPIGAAAALMLVVVVAGPIRMDWQGSQLTIAFGGIAPDTARLEQQAGLAAEIQRLENAANANGAELRQVRGQMAYLENLQRTVWKETLQNASSIQLLAQKSDLQE